MWSSNNNNSDETTAATGRLAKEYQSFLRAYGEDTSSRNPGQVISSASTNLQFGSRKRNLLSFREEQQKKPPSLFARVEEQEEDNPEDGLFFKVPKKIFRKTDKQHQRWSQTGVNSSDLDETLVKDPINSSQIKLIELRTEVAALETKVRRCEKDYVEAQILWDKKEAGYKQEKKKLEAMVSQLTIELNILREKDRHLSEEVEESRKSMDCERSKISTELNSAKEERRNSMDSYAALEVRSRQEIEQLREELFQERTKRHRSEEALEQKISENSLLRESKIQLINECADLQETTMKAEAKAQEAEQRLTQYMEECGQAMAMREEMLVFNEIKSKVKCLEEACRKYKSQSDNTILLQEKKYELQQKVQRLTDAHEKTVVGNSSCLGKIDMLMEQLTKVKQEKSALISEVGNLNDMLQLESRMLEETRNELSRKSEEFLQKLNEQENLMDNIKREAEVALGCLELEREKVEKLEGLEQILVEKNSELASLTSQFTQLQQEKENAIQELNKRRAEEDGGPQVPSSSCDEAEKLKQELLEKEELIDGLKDRLNMKGDYDPAKTKILHMEFNPLEEAHRQYKEELQILREKHKVVKTRLEELEREKEKWEGEGKGEDLNLTERVHHKLQEDKAKEEIESLKSQIRQLEKEKQRVNETHAHVGRQYREMCTLLTGYQCKMRDKEHYQVQSIYERGSDKFFLFKKSTDSELQLLESDYTPEWAGFVETYLETDGCIPAFLAAVTLQLYNQRQEGDDVSMEEAARSCSS